MLTSYEIAYHAMFYVLDAYYSKHPTPSVGVLLSDISPYLYKDRKSADPAIYDDFRKCFIQATNRTEQSDLASAYQAAKLFLKFYQDAYGYNIDALLNNFLFDDFKLAYTTQQV